MHEGLKVVLVFLSMKFGPSGYAVCNTDYEKCMQVSKYLNGLPLPDPTQTWILKQIHLCQYVYLLL